jgi:hypothetical protein
MSKSKHTPGPWVDGMSKYREGVLVVRANVPGGRILAEFGSDDEPLDETDRANARLIAAAPDLLEALNEARRYVEYLTGNDRTFVGRGMPADCLALIDAALFKAQGNQS